MWMLSIVSNHLLPESLHCTQYVFRLPQPQNQASRCFLNVCPGPLTYVRTADPLSTFMGGGVPSWDVKIIGTCSWIKLVCHTLAHIPTKSYQIFTTTSRYRWHWAVVQHKTNFATVHSWVTVGNWSVEYEYKLLCQFTRMVGYSQNG